jgi:hypothetical protein
VMVGVCVWVGVIEGVGVGVCDGTLIICVIGQLLESTTFNRYEGYTSYGDGISNESGITFVV